MGYCTSFVLCIEEGDPAKEDMDRISEMLNSFEYFQFWGDEWMACDVKWYSYNEDLFKLSKAFPQFRFYVHGDGDDSDDIWEDHWQNGRYQHCYAEIPAFDPNKMEEYHISEK